MAQQQQQQQDEAPLLAGRGRAASGAKQAHEQDGVEVRMGPVMEGIVGQHCCCRCSAGIATLLHACTCPYESNTSTVASQL